MNEREDPIIDALLAESLGGQQPPDLTARILAKWSERAANATTVTPPPIALPVSPAPAVVIPTSALRRRKTSSQWLQVVVSLTVTAAVLFVGYLGMHALPVQQPHLSHQANTQPSRPAATTKQNSPQEVPAEIAKSNSKLVQPTEKSTQPANQLPPTIMQVAPVEKPSSIASVESPPVKRSADTKQTDTKQVVSFVNAELKSAWMRANIAPAPRASDAELCRRLHVHLLGRIPTVAELKAFEEDTAADKYTKLVDRLLNDELYIEEYAKHWSTVWANILIGRGVGLDRSEVVSRAGLEKYLRDSFATNKPYSQMALELLSASGSGQLGADNFNGATNYLLAHADDHNLAATASVCRVFLGVQLQCAQCHNHPTEPFTQQQFWSMNAFLRQMKVRHADRNDPAQLLDFDYLGENGRDAQGLVYYELPNGVLKATPPMFLNGREPAVASGYVADGNRRELLAQEVVRSEQFARAVVNRMWSQFHGYGFTRPLDNMGPANPPSHPELLNGLATEFVEHGYDLKHIMRWITLSDSFQRSSRSPENALADLPMAGTAPLFSYYYTRPLQAEEVIRSLQIAAQLRRDTAKQGDIVQARVDWLAQYQRNLAKSTADSEEPNPAMKIIHSGIMKQATSPGYESLLQGVLQSKLKFTEKVEHLFLAAVSRKPTKAELAAAQKLAGLAGMNETAALEDIWWALLNSSEFLLDH
jgi:hypothetical protein